MLESLEKRFAKVEESKEVVLACLLDPRYKERPLIPDTLVQAKGHKMQDNSPETTQEDSMPPDMKEENPQSGGGPGPQSSRQSV